MFGGGEKTMLVFENQGEIDPRLIQLIGVNVKESLNPVGYFGTGLKYAIASILRWGGTIVVQSGEAEWSFHREQAQIRGREFQLISMQGRLDRQTLGFTTELGKNWEPWQVYRELWCNAHDESGGSVAEVTRPPKALAGLTRVIVDLPQLVEAHGRRAEFLLAERSRRKLLWSGERVEIWEGPGDRIFYRGIAVQELGKPSLFIWNVLAPLSLTEDRTVSEFNTDWEITRGVAAELEDESLLEQILAADETVMESRLDWNWAEKSETFRRVQERLLGRGAELHRSLRPVVETKCCPTCGRPL